MDRLNAKLIPIQGRIRELAEEDAIIDADAAFDALSTEIQALKKELRDFEIQESTFHLRYMQTIEALRENHPLIAQKQAEENVLKSMNLLRVSEEEELEGLDLHEHGTPGYAQEVKYG